MHVIVGSQPLFGPEAHIVSDDPPVLVYERAALALLRIEMRPASRSIKNESQP